MICRGALAGLLVTALAAVARGDDYAGFEKGLEASAEKVNLVRLHGSIYALGREKLQEHFRRYFRTHRLTGALRTNLWYPAFAWGSNHRALQQALATVYLESIEGFLDERMTPPRMDALFARDHALHQQYFHMLAFLVDLASSKRLDRPFRADLYRRLVVVLKRSRLASKARATVDVRERPFINSIKAQMLMTCFTFAKVLDDFGALAAVLYVRPLEAKLWTRHRVLLLDNDRFDAAQVGVLEGLVDAVPPRLRSPLVITCTAHLLGPKNKLVSIHTFRCCWVFNVFASRGRGLAVVAAHEYNHGVDAGHVETAPARKAFKQRTLQLAGRSRRNFLRSDLPDGFFAQHPQEFFAGLSNAYFEDSPGMLARALAAARNGNLNHVNQFALIAGVYSDAKRCTLYRFDESGRTHVTHTPIEMVGGLLSAIVWKGKTYRFAYRDGLIAKVEEGP